MVLNTAKKWVQLLAANNLIRLLLILIVQVQPAFSSTAQYIFPVNIAVLDDGATHEKEVIRVLSQLIRECTKCKIHAYPIYNKDGELSEKTFIESLNKALKETDIIHLSWNIESSIKTQRIEDSLNKAAKIKLVVAAAGAPSGGPNLQRPLSETVMGKVKEALIVGELNPNSRKIHMNSYTGPEMFVALTTVKNKNGSSFSLPKLTATAALKMAQQKLSLEDIKEVLRKFYKNNRPYYL